MSTQLKIKRRSKFGFTLVELMVSISILSIILLTLAQAINYVSQVWVTGIGAVDNFNKARNILSIMDRDVQEMVMRPDTAAFVDSTGTQPACAFYTNIQGMPGTGLTSGVPDTRTVSLVQYVLNPSGTPAGTLARLNYGMNFLLPANSGTPPTTGNTSSLPAPANSNLETDTLATGVIRFQWQFVDGSGNFLTPASSSAYNFAYNYTTPCTASNPRAVIISILVLSNSAYQLATQNTAIMTQLQTDFPDTLPSGTNQTFSQYWNSVLNPTTGTLDPTLPATVRSGLQVFQRYVPLPVSAP